MIAFEPDALLRNACPLEHPPDYSVRVKKGMVRLYKANCLDVNGVYVGVPHTFEQNRDWRRRTIELTAESDEYRQQVLSLCAQPCPQSLILWMNLFGVTFVQQEIDAKGHQKGTEGRMVPMITWPTQDRAATELYYAISDGYDWAVDKSRQMGATWLICFVFAWFFMFRPNMHFDVLSETEDLVDRPGDPLSIFWKLDYIIEHLPAWMRPGIQRHRLRYESGATGSTINGRSSTANKGRGGSRNAVLFDEAALNKYLEPLWDGYGPSCASRGINSTPRGPTYFSELIARAGNGPAAPLQLIQLPWFEHHIKGRGRRVMTDPDTGDQFIASDYYIEECKRASSDAERWWLARKTRAIAQELDMDHVGSGDLVFNFGTINRQKALCPDVPDYQGDLKWTGRTGTKIPALKRGEVSQIEFVSSSKGCWELWCELEEDENGFWRPPQARTYVFGADVSLGVGASESTLCAFCVEEGRKVGQYRCSTVSPVKFAVQAAMAGYWFGGAKKCAMITPESNGPGISFIRTLVKLGYLWIFREKDSLRKGGKKSKAYGWSSSDTKKRDACVQLDDAMGRGEFIDPSRASLEQAAQFINYEGGGIGPARLATTTATARALHGDIVTANLTAWYGAQRIGFVKAKELEAPRGSPAWRRKNLEYERRRVAQGDADGD